MYFSRLWNDVYYITVFTLNCFLNKPFNRH